MDGNSSLTTTSTKAPPTARCYIVELPIELRAIIYIEYFKSSTNLSALLDHASAQAVARALAKDSNNLRKKASLLCTCREILRETLPLYQKKLQLQQVHLKCALDGAEQAMGAAGNITERGYFLVEYHLGSIADLRCAKQMTERSLVAWVQLEKNLLKGGAAKKKKKTSNSRKKLEQIDE